MRKERGYSLIEILVAFAILALILTMTLAVFLERDRRLKQANETIRAYQALGNEAELVRRKTFIGVVAASSFSSELQVLEPLSPFTTAIEVVPISLYRKDVTLIVRWGEGRRGGAREAKLGLVRTDTGGTNLW